MNIARASFRADRFDFDLDCNIVADHPLATGALPYPEVAALERRRGNAPAGCRIVRRRLGIAEQLDVQCYCARHSMHCQVAANFSSGGTGLFHPAAFEGDFRILLHVEEIRAAQMHVPFRIRGIDAARLDRRDDRGLFRVVPIDFNRSAEFRELAFRAPEHVPDFEGYRGVRRVEFENLIRPN